MEEIQQLLAAWENRLEALRQETAHLREGLAHLHTRYSGLERQNTDLHAQRESLERQVMDMASVGWENVIELYSLEALQDAVDDDDDDPESVA